jgi:hypothetical protein
MIIRVESTAARDVEEVRHSLEAMAHGWGQEITAAQPAAAGPGTPHHGDGKAVDPVALASLVLSIPSAALAVQDLADRTRKRRRASELIAHARHLADQQITVTLVTGGRAVELRTLTPDQLLDLQGGEDPVS